jgi:plasmid stabilization system protein ParE
MSVRILPAASDDVVGAVAWIERHTAQGDVFDAAFGRSVAALGANPQMYPRAEDGPDEPETREFFIARFEHRVVYALRKGEDIIVAVIHTRTRPRSWHGRLTELH